MYRSMESMGIFPNLSLELERRVEFSSAAVFKGDIDRRAVSICHMCAFGSSVGC